MNMNGNDFDNDQHLDENLRLLSAHLKLPAPPTAEQQRRWRSPSTLSELGTLHSHSPRGIKLMKRYGILTTMAAAAAIFAAITLWPTGQTPVHARTILQSLSATPHRGIRIECRNLVAEKAHVDARVSVLFNRELSLAELIEKGDAAADLKPTAAYVSATIATEEGFDELGAMKLQAQIAITENEQWVWFRMPEIPQKLIEEAPPIVLFQGILRGGVLLDLAGLKDLGFDVSDMLNGDGGGHHDGAEVTINFGNGSDLSDEEDAEAKLESSLEMDLGDDPLGKQILGLLSGDAGREQVEALMEELQKQAESSRVFQRDDGVWILSAENFTTDGDETMKNARLEVAYREGAGVEWLELSRLGDSNGVVRIEWIDAISDSDRLSKDALLNDGSTRLIDASKLIESIQAMGVEFGANGDGAEGEPK